MNKKNWFSLSSPVAVIPSDKQRPGPNKLLQGNKAQNVVTPQRAPQHVLHDWGASLAKIDRHTWQITSKNNRQEVFKLYQSSNPTILQYYVTRDFCPNMPIFELYETDFKPISVKYYFDFLTLLALTSEILNWTETLENCWRTSERLRHSIPWRKATNLFNFVEDYKTLWQSNGCATIEMTGKSVNYPHECQTALSLNYMHERQTAPSLNYMHERQMAKLQSYLHKCQIMAMSR